MKFTHLVIILQGNVDSTKIYGIKKYKIIQLKYLKLILDMEQSNEKLEDEN